MKEYRVFISEHAEKDINNIINYVAYELKNKIATITLANNIKEAILSLNEFSQRHPLIEDNYLSKQGYRKIIVDNFIIFYIISEKNKSVNIIRVLNNRRNWIDFLT